MMASKSQTRVDLNPSDNASMGMASSGLEGVLK
jgi:hypothetical protein